MKPHLVVTGSLTADPHLPKTSMYCTCSPLLRDLESSDDFLQEVPGRPGYNYQGQSVVRRDIQELTEERSDSATCLREVDSHYTKTVLGNLTNWLFRQLLTPCKKPKKTTDTICEKTTAPKLSFCMESTSCSCK